MALALFDLDHTLLAGDSDYLWGEFLCDLGVVDRETYRRENARYYRDYQAGRLDIHEFLRFGLAPLAAHAPDDLFAWRRRFITERIEPIVAPAGLDALAGHRQQGDRPVIITATNAFVTAPIAELLGVADLLATEPEIVNGRYTGNVSGIPCFREGKVKRLEAWLATHEASLADSWFYSDSHNDLPLLEAVTHPVAVNPDPVLKQAAERLNWPVRDWMGGRGDPRDEAPGP